MNLYFPHFPALPEEPRPPSLPTREADICLSAGWIIFHTTSSSSFFKHNFQEHRPSRQKTGRKYYKNCKNSTLVPGIVILQQLEQQRQREEAEKQRDSRVRFFRNGCCRLERHGNVNLRSAWMCCGKKTRRTNPQLPGDTKSILFFIHVTLWSINIIRFCNYYPLIKKHKHFQPRSEEEAPGSDTSEEKEGGSLIYGKPSSERIKQIANNAR